MNNTYVRLLVFALKVDSEVAAFVAIESKRSTSNRIFAERYCNRRRRFGLRCNLSAPNRLA